MIKNILQAAVLIAGLDTTAVASPPLSAPLGTASKSPRTTPGAPADGAFSNAASTASSVFEATITEIGGSPGAWSGAFVAYQTVTYRISKVHADRDRSHHLTVGTTVTVRHALVAQSETADREPQLRPDLVRRHASVIVLAAWREGHWTGVDERHGIVVNDEAHRIVVARK